jgi:hypothetical protein
MRRTECQIQPKFPHFVVSDYRPVWRWRRGYGCVGTDVFGDHIGVGTQGEHFGQQGIDGGQGADLALFDAPQNVAQCFQGPVCAGLCQLSCI